MPLELLQQNTVSSRVKVCNSGLLSNCHRYLRVPIVFQKVSQPSSHFEAYNSSFLWSCKTGVGSPIEFRWGIWTFSTCTTGESYLLHVVRGWILGVPLDQLRGIRPCLEFTGGTRFPFYLCQELRDSS